MPLASSDWAAVNGPQDNSSSDEQLVGLARASQEASLQHDRQWIASLGRKWQNHHGQDLRLRYDTGKTLNDRLRPPTVRLPRGEGIMTLLVDETGLSESSLNRMRWFAYRFPSFEEFKASQLGVDSWEKVCVTLVGISQKEKAAEAAANGSAIKSSAPSKGISGILRSLKVVAQAMPKEQVPVDEDVIDDLETGLRKFRRALQKCTGLTVTISIA